MVCVCLCVCVCARTCACARVCVCARARDRETPTIVVSAGLVQDVLCCLLPLPLQQVLQGEWWTLNPVWWGGWMRGNLKQNWNLLTGKVTMQCRTALSCSAKSCTVLRFTSGWLALANKSTQLKALNHTLVSCSCDTFLFLVTFSKFSPYI